MDLAFLCTPVSSTNKNDRRDITEILLKVALTTINNQPFLKHNMECKKPEYL
jgi:hypothetical protein